MSPKVTHSVEFNIDEAKATAIGETLLDQFNNKKGFFDGYTSKRESTLCPRTWRKEAGSTPCTSPT